MTVLGGGGNEISGYRSHRSFYTLMDDPKPRVLYIPIALNPLKHPWDECLLWIKKAFREIGDIHIDLMTELANISMSLLDQYNGIYIGGGNTYKLRKSISDARFEEVLRSYETEGVIYGGSAGAVIMGKDISTAEAFDSNDVGLIDTSGLDLILGYSVWPHYVDEHSSQIEKWVEKHKKPVVAISEEDHATINDGKLDLFGQHHKLYETPH